MVCRLDYDYIVSSNLVIFFFHIRSYFTERGQHHTDSKRGDINFYLIYMPLYIYPFFYKLNKILWNPTSWFWFYLKITRIGSTMFKTSIALLSVTQESQFIRSINKKITRQKKKNHFGAIYFYDFLWHLFFMIRNHTISRNYFKVWVQ